MPHPSPTPGQPAPVTPVGAAALADRIVTLEREQRRLRRLLAAIGLGSAAALVAIAAVQPGFAGSQVVLTAPNGQTTAALALGDDGTLLVRIAGTLRGTGRGPGGSVMRDFPVRGDFAFIPGTVRGDLAGLPGVRGPEVRVLEDGRVLAQLGGPLARPLMP
jgi:hypothetical protein